MRPSGALVSACRATGGCRASLRSMRLWVGARKLECFLRPQQCADAAGNWSPLRGVLSHGPIISVCTQNFCSLLQVRHSMAQYVFSMNRVGKIVPPKRQILKDISLSFFPGAKIGMLGLNGSGKSTLLKIMAGVDKEYEGEA